MASNCTLGIQNLVKTTLNNKPWFEYDQSLGIVNILDSFAKKINKENSHGVAKTTAITINKQINLPNFIMFKMLKTKANRDS
jgi:hypothetical protein